MSTYDKIVGATAGGLLPPAVLDLIGPNVTDTGTPPVGKGELSYSATDYGMSTSAGDNSPALTAALAAASTDHKAVTVPPGVYTMGTMVSLPSGTDLRLDPGAVLDFSGSGSSYYIGILGDISDTFEAISSGAVEGAYSVVAATTGVSAGDWVRVASDDVFDAANTGTTLGELIQVRSVTGTSITFWTPLRDTYTTNPTVQVASMVKNVRVTGGVIRGNFTPGTSKSGISARFVENLFIAGLRIEGVDTRHLGIDGCVNAWVTDCQFHWAETTNMAYGVSFANCTRDSGAMRNRFSYNRHAFSTNNDSSSNKVGIVRRITFAFNTVEATSEATGGGGGDAIDTHGAADDINILYNTVNGSSGSGINIECKSGRVIGNTILDPVAHGIAAHNETDRDGDFVIANNTVRNSGWDSIRASSGARGGLARNRGMVISGNVLKDGVNGINAGRSVTASAVTDSSTVITNNSIYNMSGYAFKLIKTDTATVNGNTVYLAAQGMQFENIAYGSIGPDSVRNGNNGGFVGINLIDVTNSRIQPGGMRASGSGSIGVKIASDCADLTVGPTSHISSITPLENNGPASVVTGA